MENLNRAGKVVVAELLHLVLHERGIEKSHTFVNKKIVPRAMRSGRSLVEEMDACMRHSRQKKLVRAWKSVPKGTRYLLEHPEKYIGDSIKASLREAKNALN